MARGKGFSQLEILAALAVLTIGILGVASVFLSTYGGVKQVTKRTAALDAAEELVELIRARGLIPFGSSFPSSDNSGLFDAPAVRRPLNAAPFAPDFPSGSSYARNIHVRRLSPDATSYQYGVAVIEVSLFWEEEGRGKSVRLVSYQREP